MLMRVDRNSDKSRQMGDDDNALLRAIVDNAVDAILVIDEKGIVQTANPATERLFGYPLNDLVGRNVKLLMPEPYHGSHDDYLRRFLTTGERRIIGIGREVSGRRADGSVFPMYLSVAEVHEGDSRYFAGIIHDLSTQKEAENALRESEQRLRDFTEAASDWTWEMDQQFRLTQVSETLYRMTGVTPDQVLGHTRWELADEDPESPEWRRHRDDLEQHRAFRDFIYRPRLQGSEGQEFYFKLSGKPVFDSEGRFYGYRGTGTDVTERMLARRALRESRRSLNNLISNVRGMVYRCRNTPERPMDFVSGGGEALTGYATGELSKAGGVSYAGLIHKDDRESVWQAIQSAVSAHKPFELTYRIRTRTGGEKWVLENGCGIYADDERQISLEGLILDISEQREAARELQRMRSYLKNIIDSMPSLLVGVDTEGRVTEWNLGAERKTGITAQDAIGRDFDGLFPELAAQMHNITEAIRSKRPIRTERMPVKENDDTRFADIMVYPLLANGVTGAVIRLDDVTERIRIEQMMVQTEKMLSVGGLAAGMAHEISNPLSIIMQSAQNMQRRLSKELPANRSMADALGVDLEALGRYLDERGISGFVDSIKEAGVRASRIVADMLAFSRRSASQLTPNRLDEMLETVVRLAGSDYDLKKKYDFRQIEILRDYDADLGEVTCDRTQIEQVLLNLIKNAAHAMADAETAPPRRIWLRTRREGDYALIEVEDNGPGMPEATRKRAFEPFFTTKQAGVGTGLGLSVSYFIITEQHKGTISVSSKEGEGCRFIIRLPIITTGTTT